MASGTLVSIFLPCCHCTILYIFCVCVSSSFSEHASFPTVTCGFLLFREFDLVWFGSGFFVGFLFCLFFVWLVVFFALGGGFAASQ